MLFHFVNFSQCVVCMFGHKTIYKVHSKGRYFVFFNKIPFQELQRTARLDYKLFSCTCDITNFKSRLWKFEWLAFGENAWLSTARFKIITRRWCFYITVFLMETDCFQKNLDVIFIHIFIWHIMSDKAEFVSGVLICVQRYHGNLALSHSNITSCWQGINLHIYVPQIV